MNGHTEVFVVRRVHTLEDGEEDAKLIGIYTSREFAQHTVERLQLQPGFRDTPEGFSIDLYWLDQDHWTDGYVTL